MPGETDVANAALELVGAAAIVSLTEGSEKSNTVSNFYEIVRDDLLRSHNWNFATKRQKLAQSATDPAFEFDHAYPLPADWMRTISVHDNDAGHGTIFYRMEKIGSQRAIITSSDDVYLRYVYRETDPNVMTADFVLAFTLSLASRLAVPIASSKSLRDEYADEAKSKTAAARSSDAIGAFPELRPRGSWAASRGGRRRNDWMTND